MCTKYTARRTYVLNTHSCVSLTPRHRHHCGTILFLDDKIARVETRFVHDDEDGSNVHRRDFYQKGLKQLSTVRV